MTTVTLEEAKKMLEDLVNQGAPERKVVIVCDGEPIAELTKTVSDQSGAPVFGFWKGMVEIVSDDDDHLHDFREYME